MKTKVKLLGKLLKEEVRKRFHQHQEEDEEVLLVKGDGFTYRQTERAQEAESVLVFLSNTSVTNFIGRTNFVKVRDHLICLVLFSNACRSGVLQNVTYHDLCKATDHYSDQTKQISVWFCHCHSGYIDIRLAGYSSLTRVYVILLLRPQIQILMML